MNHSKKAALLPTLAVAAIATTTIYSAPAFATTAPVAGDDRFVSAEPTQPVGNLLANDRHDPSTTLKITDVFQTARDVTNSSTSPTTYSIAWAADGTAKVTFTSTAGTPQGAEAGAWYTYTAVDSLGQKTTAQAYFGMATKPDLTLAAVDDNPTTTSAEVPADINGAIQIQDDGTTSFPVTDNDTHPAQPNGPGQYFNVVLVPGSTVGGTATVGADGDPQFTPDPAVDSDFTGSYTYGSDGALIKRYTPRHTASFDYRLCQASNPADCSNAAHVTFDYTTTRTIKRPTAGSGFVLYDGGPASATYSLRTEAEKALRDPALITNAKPYADQTCTGSPLADSYTVTAAQAQAATVTTTAYWCDASGSAVARTDVAVRWASTPVAPRTAPDEFWAQVGQTVPLRVELNDTDYPRNTEYGYGHFVLATAPSNGTVFTNDVAMKQGDEARNLAGMYFRGNAKGDQVVYYRSCAGWFNDNACSAPTKVLIHVTPLGKAVDDSVRFQTGQARVVSVLANDTFTDVNTNGTNAPAPTKAIVTLGSVPTALQASLNPDRTVTVSGKPGSWDIPYSLRDLTGTTRATVHVTITAPTTTKVDAVDDHATGYAGDKIPVDLIANDVLDAHCGVRSVTASNVPAGVKVSINGGKATVVVPKRLAGKTVGFSYRLTDTCGNADIARVFIQTPASVTTGADQSLGSPADRPVSYGLLAGGGLSALAGAGLLLRRRKVTR